jgi:hypothetical protein
MNTSHIGECEACMWTCEHVEVKELLGVMIAINYGSVVFYDQIDHDQDLKNLESEISDCVTI